jgi:TetR/AcrR family transcriptional regulator, transcriptional repressor for nem operon
MKTPTGRKALSHQRIVQAASQELRRSGLNSVGVADVMKRAGLTHGGFYAHFDSRDTLLAEAMESASQESVARIAADMERLQAQGMSPFRALVELYLGEDHVRDCEHGCPMPAVCAELPHQAPALHEVSRHMLVRLRDGIARTLPANTAPGAAWIVLSTLIGAVQLARALGDTQETSTMLAETRNDLLRRYDV